MRQLSFMAVALVVIYLLAAALALGQGGNPPASTKESGQTSGKGMTTVEQSGKTSPPLHQPARQDRQSAVS